MAAEVVVYGDHRLKAGLCARDVHAQSGDCEGQRIASRVASELASRYSSPTITSDGHYPWVGISRMRAIGRERAGHGEAFDASRLASSKPIC